jgi:hypothetical protein
MEAAFGVLHLTHDELFALTPFQFTQLYRGWEEREKLEQIRNAQLMVTIANSNRWDEKQPVVTIQDILPWYEEYVPDEVIEEIDIPMRPAIPRDELLLMTTHQILEQRGLDPETVTKDSEEWTEAENIAIICCGPEAAEDSIVLEGGIEIKKVDPKVFGKAPWGE